MKYVPVRMPDELFTVLSEEAAYEEQSVSSLIRKAVKTYLEDLRDYRIGSKAYKEYVKNGKKGIKLKDLAKELNIEL